MKVAVAEALPVGKLIQMIAISRFTRTLSTLLTSGIPLFRALDIVKHVVNNVHLQDAIESAREAIGQGADFAGPLSQSRLFPPIVLHMINVGERTGELEGMLAKVSDSYDSEVEIRVTALTSALEPILILTMGVVIGFIVVSVLLPIFQMTQGVG